MSHPGKRRNSGDPPVCFHVETPCRGVAALRSMNLQGVFSAALRKKRPPLDKGGLQGGFEAASCTTPCARGNDWLARFAMNDSPLTKGVRGLSSESVGMERCVFRELLIEMTFSRGANTIP